MFSCESFIADANIAVYFVKSDALPVVLTRQIATWRLQNENNIIIILNQITADLFLGKVTLDDFFFSWYVFIELFGCKIDV